MKDELRPEELRQAEIYWFKQSQQEDFKEELSALKEGKEIAKKSNLLKLNPRLDEKEVLRMHGRLKKGRHLDEETRNPILLPRRYYITKICPLELSEN